VSHLFFSFSLHHILSSRLSYVSNALGSSHDEAGKAKNMEESQHDARRSERGKGRTNLLTERRCRPDRHETGAKRAGL